MTSQDDERDQSSDVAWSFGVSVPSDGYDLDSIMSHETGRLLGLAYSDVTTAVMFPSYMPGTSTLRKLAADDAWGI